MQKIKFEITISIVRKELNGYLKSLIYIEQVH